MGSYGSSSSLPLIEMVEEEGVKIVDGGILAFFRGGIQSAEAVASLIKQEGVESIFTTGDNNYEYGCKSDIDRNIGRLYKGYIGNYSGTYGEGAKTNEFFPTRGNHDVLVYEAYLIKKNEPITLGLFGAPEYRSFQNNGTFQFSNRSSRFVDDLNYRFSRKNWVYEFLNISNETLATNLVQHLLDAEPPIFETRDVTLKNGNQGTSYLPKRAITLGDFTSSQQSDLRTSITGALGTSVSDSVINYFFKKIVNIYCILEDHSQPTLPYDSYFTLPGNERYYKVSKEHNSTRVDIFILNITDTFNSETAHEPDGNTVGSVQHQWFVREVTNSDADFKIALVHDEPYGSFENSPLVQPWNLEQYVDVVMSGDVQSYERSKIKTDHGEALFLSVGVGGLGLETENPTPVPSSISLIKEYGALFMQINSEGLDFKFKNKDGEVKDTFTLEKSQ